MLIIPSVLTDNAEEALLLVDKLSDVILPHGFALERIQIDINDGTFLNVKTIDPQALSDVETDLKFDFHLMVSDPQDWINKCSKGDRLIGQVEKMQSQVDFVQEVVNLGKNAGLAVDFSSEVSLLDTGVMETLDVVLLMTYPAGLGGQQFRDGVFGKIEELTELKQKSGFNFKICLDGGITLDNINRVKQSGVDEVVVGGRVTHGDIEENLEKFYKAMY